MKHLLTLTSFVSSIVILALMAACQTTGTSQSAVSQKEALLAQAGFQSKAVTTPKQQQLVSQLAVDKVSAVKYQGKLYYVFPTEKKDQILVGKQAQFNAYKQALAAQRASQTAQQGSQTAQQGGQTAQQRQQMLYGTPTLTEETAGPKHIQVEVFDGFGPMELQGE